MTNRTATRICRRWAAAISVGVLMMSLSAGCGKAKPGIKGKLPLFPVAGKLIMDGQPMAGATLLFHPTNDFPTGSASQRPRAIVGEDGTFQVSTYANDDGAPAGEYRVTVSWKADTDGTTSEQQQDLPEMAPRTVQNPRQSHLRVKIKQGENKLPTWDLTEEHQASNTP